MSQKITDSSQAAEAGNPSPPPGQAQAQVEADNQNNQEANKIYKSGPLFLSSRGIGWTSWKKRWFILTRTSLVFFRSDPFRSDPNGVPQKGGEVTVTLGGIDLNNSGSVVVKADKKLLTVLFPDGRDGRAFTLKAETSEDLTEWKNALEEALTNAPNAAPGMGQNGLLNTNDQADGNSEQPNDKPQPKVPKSQVVGQPLLLALEEIDGKPSFLEKALRYIEDHGVKVEGILRQAADVDDVERRIREYEQGKTNFSAEEDAHVIGDCVKYVLRELPSPPVPASCCTSLLEACRTERGKRVAAMRSAICETFPEPNRRLLQRLLIMMQAVASHKAENRMSNSAVAACMAPLLLRSLMSGECDMDTDFNMLADSSVLLMQAAAAANHAQAIVITLLDEYDTIFGEESMPEIYSESDMSGSEGGDLSDDDYDESFEDDDEYYDDDDEEEEDEEEEEEEGSEDEAHSQTSSHAGSDTEKNDHTSPKGSKSVDVDNDIKAEKKLSTSSSYKHDNSVEKKKLSSNLSRKLSRKDTKRKASREEPVESSSKDNKSNETNPSIEAQLDDRSENSKSEVSKTELPRSTQEPQPNEFTHETLMKLKSIFHEHRRALEEDVARLKDRLKKERELRAELEGGVRADGILPVLDKKMKEELEEIDLVQTDILNLKQNVVDLQEELQQEHEQNLCFISERNKGINKESEAAATSSKSEAVKSNKLPITNFKKPTVVKEGANSTTSALSRLTNRLNFLKERRSQIACELQTYDKAGGGRSSGGLTVQKPASPSDQDRISITSPSNHSTSPGNHSTSPGNYSPSKYLSPKLNKEKGTVTTSDKNTNNTTNTAASTTTTNNNNNNTNSRNNNKNTSNDTTSSNNNNTGNTANNNNNKNKNTSNDTANNNSSKTGNTTNNNKNTSNNNSNTGTTTANNSKNTSYNNTNNTSNNNTTTNNNTTSNNNNTNNSSATQSSSKRSDGEPKESIERGKSESTSDTDRCILPRT